MISYYVEVVTFSELQLNGILEHEIISSEVHTFSNLLLTPDKIEDVQQRKLKGNNIAVGLSAGLCQER